MRLLIPRLIFGLAATTLALGQKVAQPADLEKDVLKIKEDTAPKPAPAVDSKDGSSASTEVDPTEGTVFNGEKVPPMKDLRGDTFKEDIKNGWW